MRYKALYFLCFIALSSPLMGQQTLTWNGGGDIFASDGNGAWNAASWILRTPGTPDTFATVLQSDHKNIATFIGVNGTAGTITLADTIVMSNTLTFNQTSSSKYELTGTGTGTGITSTSSLTINNSNGATFNNGNNSFTSVNFGSVLTGSVDGSGSLTAGSFTAQKGTIAVSLQGVGAFTKTETDTVTLSGNNSYSGGTNVNAGILNAGAANALGTGNVSVATGAILNVGASNAIANNATVNVSGDLNLSALVSDTVGTVNLTGGIIGGSGTLTGSSYAFQSGTVNANLGSANLNKTTAGILTLNSSNTYGTVTLTQGAIGGSGSITASSFVVQEGSISNTLSGSASLAKNTAGTVTLSGISNNYSGGTNVNAGTLNANSSGALGSGNVTINSGATLNFGANNVINDSASLTVAGTLNVSNFTDTIGSLSLNSGGNITGTGTLNATSIALQSGTISANLAGSAALTKTGAGTVTLTGTNSYSGGTTVNEGTLIANSLGTGNVSVSNNAILQTNLSLGVGQVLGGSGTLSGNLVFNSGAILNLDPSLTNIMTITGTMSFTNFKLTSLTGFDWQNAAAGTYRLLNGGSATFDATSNTSANKFDLGGGRFGYFQSGSLDLIITAVPEPSSLALLIVGGLGLTLRRRVRR